jgi:hypothetical protein
VVFLGHALERKSTMMKMSAFAAVSVGLFLPNGAQAAEIDLQRNTPAVIDGILYPVSGRPLVLPDMEDVLAAFVTTRSELNAVANLTDQSVVRVIVVDPMVDANADAIASAEAANQQDVAKLRAAINANAELTNDLESRDVEVSTVLAADLLPSGVLVLYALG